MWNHLANRLKFYFSYILKAVQTVYASKVFGLRQFLKVQSSVTFYHGKTIQNTFLCFCVTGTQEIEIKNGEWNIDLMKVHKILLQCKSFNDLSQGFSDVI